MMIEATPVEKKLQALERIVKAITYTEKISYHGKEPSYISFHGADPDNFKLRGYAEGLDLDWSAELYEREGIDLLGEDALTEDAQMLAEVWLFEDPYKRIEELEKQIQSFDTTVRDEE